MRRASSAARQRDVLGMLARVVGYDRLSIASPNGCGFAQA